MGCSGSFADAASGINATYEFYALRTCLQTKKMTEKNAKLAAWVSGTTHIHMPACAHKLFRPKSAYWPTDGRRNYHSVTRFLSQ